jgi:hypothetical protein
MRIQTNKEGLLVGGLFLLVAVAREAPITRF